ncbi:hypothetical protein PsorP6_000931 [Peronosclerospora sorghi]|uniref:Uncharacterized protein n=1 Tax=Peronosclerospora sorghi TaxID=230839 RepID=A0ACC0WW30_9STRA|nr:hypothetical protein PsorP6_000931 [Peronosclerospora sorghi]
MYPDHDSDVHGIEKPSRIVRGSKVTSGSRRVLSGFEHVERMLAAQEMESRSATTISRACHPSQTQTLTEPPAKRVRHCRHCQITAHDFRRCADHALLLAQQMLDATATRSDVDIPATSDASDPPARSIASPALTPVLLRPQTSMTRKVGEGYAEGDVGGVGGVGGSKLQPDGDNNDHMEDDWDHEEFDPWAGLDNLDVPFEEFRGRFGLMFEESFPITSKGRGGILWRRVFDDFHASEDVLYLDPTRPHRFDMDRRTHIRGQIICGGLEAVFTNEDRLAWY